MLHRIELAFETIGFYNIRGFLLNPLGGTCLLFNAWRRVQLAFITHENPSWNKALMSTRNSDLFEKPRPPQEPAVFDGIDPTSPVQHPREWDETLSRIKVR